MMAGVQNRPTIVILVAVIGHPLDRTMLRVRLDGTTANPTMSVATSWNAYFSPNGIIVDAAFQVKMGR